MKKGKRGEKKSLLTRLQELLNKNNVQVYAADGYSDSSEDSSEDISNQISTNKDKAPPKIDWGKIVPLVNSEAAKEKNADGSFHCIVHFF